MSKLTSLELWRLADTLSVTNAAILITGGDPSSHFWNDDGARVQETWQHDGYEAAFNALRGAILSNKLQASVKHSMRGSRVGFSGHEGEGPYDILSQPNEEQISYDLLIARHDKSINRGAIVPGKTSLNFSLDDLRGERFLYVCKEPNWDQTTVDVDHLQEWLKHRGVFPAFFFPEGRTDSVLNRNNNRYSAKLACAIAAWEAVKTKVPNKSVKQTLQDWVQSNGVQYGLGENGVVSPNAAEEIAKIANWDPKGGANPTSIEAPETKPEKPIENYPFGYENRDLDDSDIPF